MLLLACFLVFICEKNNNDNNNSKFGFIILRLFCFYKINKQKNS